MAQYHFYRMRDRGLLDTINAVLLAGVRVAEGREAEPTAGIIDSQSVKPPKPADHAAMTRARRSKGASANRDRHGRQPARRAG